MLTWVRALVKSVCVQWCDAHLLDIVCIEMFAVELVQVLVASKHNLLL